VFVARQVARARLDLGVACSKETQQRPESVARFRRTGRKAAVDGGLSRTDGLVGMAQLEVGERVYRDDTPAVTDVLSHRHTFTPNSRSPLSLTNVVRLLHGFTVGLLGLSVRWLASYINPQHHRHQDFNSLTKSQGKNIMAPYYIGRP